MIEMLTVIQLNFKHGDSFCMATKHNFQTTAIQFFNYFFTIHEKRLSLQIATYLH